MSLPSDTYSYAHDRVYNGTLAGYEYFVKMTVVNDLRLRGRTTGLLDDPVFKHSPREFHAMITRVYQKSVATAYGIVCKMTINPPPSVDWFGLLKFWEVLCSSKNLLYGAEMVLEQRSTDPSTPHGWHMHIATRALDYSVGKITQRIFKLYLSNVGEIDILRITGFKSPTAYSYILGIKDTEEKLLKVKADRIIRDKKNLDHIYRQCPIEKVILVRDV